MSALNAAADHRVWQPEASLTIYDIRQVHEQALADLPATGRVSIDLSNVEEIDTAGLQWLIFFSRCLAQRELGGQVLAVSGAVDDFLTLMRGREALQFTHPTA
ncbi:STAS domain-containing protein [Marinobacter sp. NFXS9]|uniref:STAS domain-containing protein n=1 Tax=Marinobacter sp. NFXS9 TaxID=2818433 RepID=UPI0032DE603C